MEIMSLNRQISGIKGVGQVVRRMSSVEFNEVTEGLATILYPKSEKVFYNPIQQFNRDLSVCAIRAWAELDSTTRKRKRDEEGSQPFIRIIEGLAASGLRSVRYAKEIPRVKTIIANDLSPDAAAAIRRNVEHNGTSEIVQVTEGDANQVLRNHKKKPAHVVDLDPYGTAAPFLDSAIQAIADNGILLVTCTDLAVLAGNGYPEKCFSLYGGTTVRNDATHESALRLLLNTVATCAARYGKSIEPLLSLSIDYYVRCVIRVKNSPISVKQNLGKSMIVYNCTGCQSTHLQPLGKVSENKNSFKFGYAKGPVVGTHCEFCQNPFHIAGPMWSGPLHSKTFIEQMLQVESGLSDDTYGTIPRIRGMLTLAAQELETPFYVSPANMASKVRCPAPPIKTFVAAILNGGYGASLTHAKAGCIKTNAPYSFLWDIMRAWAEENKAKKDMKNSPGAKILEGKRVHDISFAHDPRLDEIENLRKSKLALYPQNPRAEWGPQSKA